MSYRWRTSLCIVNERKTISRTLYKCTFLRIFFVLVTSGVSDFQFFETTLKEHFKLSNRMSEFDVSNDCDREAQWGEAVTRNPAEAPQEKEK